MITREEAAAYLAKTTAAFGRRDDTAARLAHTVVALYDERDKAPDRRLLATIDDINDEVDMAHRARLRAEQERDALALELRRLRAAEAPGTDDAAFAGTGWGWRWAQGQQGWHHNSGECVWKGANFWTHNNIDRVRLALDAMRAAVPGSV